MGDGITVRILGDYGPFSRMGKSIGYQIIVGQSSYLIDCGSPVFQQIGGHGLKDIRGMLITHCHDDHKRWFTDLALFNMYAPDVPHRVSLLTTEEINNELVRSSGAALDRSLSGDSKSVIDVPYEAYIDFRMMGPRARYRIVSKEEGAGLKRLCVTDDSGNIVGPETAKIVISSKTKRPRLLFKDPDYKEWVEPESFYSFSSDIFYKKEKNIYTDRDEGFTIETIKAPVWHGVPGIGIKVTTAEETLIFSSDTVHDTEVWEQLYSEKRSRKSGMTEKEFESASIIYGNINDYIERTWSEDRYREAMSSFDDAVVIHDIATRNSVVHTDYRRLDKTVLKKEMVILTHSPDRMTSEWVLSKAGKSFQVKGDKFFEIVEDELYPLDADVYHKEEGRYYVGYRNENGNYVIFDKDGILGIALNGARIDGTPLYRVDFQEDVSGKYFPRIDSGKAVYFERPDGKIELIEFSGKGSNGKIVENIRGKVNTEYKLQNANSKV